MRTVRIAEKITTVAAISGKSARPSAPCPLLRFSGIAAAMVLMLACGMMRGESGARAPRDLRCESMVTPLGIDSPRPEFSWKLDDERRGARQTAYQIVVLSSAGRNATPVWDSGKVTSDASVHVSYAGPVLQPSRRYFWRVRVWDESGTVYPESKVSWWEMGLLSEAWRGQWIGYEPKELHAIRQSGATWIKTASGSNAGPNEETHYGFRLPLELNGPVKRAVLYAAGEHNVAAWVDQTPTLGFQPVPAWGMLPWATYRKVDVTRNLHPGRNLVAIEVARFPVGLPATRPGGAMSMCLYIEMMDGSIRLVTSSDDGWRAKPEPSGRWQATDFDGQAWQAAAPYHGNRLEATGLPWPTGPVAIMRHGFVERSPILSARLYATALGAYKFHLNGAPVGDQILAPGWTDYRERVTYQVYDVTKQVHEGSNEIAALLAPGWYSTKLQDAGRGNNYGATQPALRAQLRIEHSDGTVEWIASGTAWQAGVSATSEAEIYDGESFDARKVVRDWDTAAPDGASWEVAMAVSPRELEILAQNFPPIRAEQTLQAKAVTQPNPGVYVFDFGQDMAGVPHVRFKGTAGQRIQLRFAEVLNADGTIYTENLRNAKATDVFILAGTGSAEEWQPQFTYHGFRYIEVTGLKEAPETASVEAVVMHTDATQILGMKTSNALVQKIWSNILWGQRSNFMSVPTDCPQRDERLGWTADAQVFWKTASYDWDLTSFSRKYARDMRGTQVGTAMYGSFAPGTAVSNWGGGPGWSDAGVIIPWTSWLQTGDREIIEQNWQAMDDYVQSILAENPNFLWRKGIGVPYGDWLSPTISTPEDLIATAYWAYDAKLMEQMATAVGRTAEALRYQKLEDSIRKAFMAAYVSADGIVGEADNFPSMQHRATPMNADGTRPFVETQTGYVLALYMGLVPENLRQQAADRLASMIEANHGLLGTGFLGTPYLLEVLTTTGHDELAYKILLNRDYPSWGYLVDHGATTTWERWNGDQMLNDPHMNSFNHYAYGAVGEWMYRYAGGLDATSLDAGFHTIRLQPMFDPRLGDIHLSLDTPYGTAGSEWTIQGEMATWTATVPPNTRAEISRSVLLEGAVSLEGKALGESPLVRQLKSGEYELAPGVYKFSIRLAPERLNRGN